MKTRGVPTVVGGVQYRSRLEAKWALFFSEVGWPFQYEPVDLPNWIPDFSLRFATPILVEIKPALTYQEVENAASSLLSKISNAPSTPEILVVGTGPFPVPDDRSFANSPAFGALIPARRGGVIETAWENSGVDVALAVWCEQCKGYSLTACDGSWHCRRCGTHPDAPDTGPRGLGTDRADVTAYLDETFARLGNETQWRGPQRRRR